MLRSYVNTFLHMDLIAPERARFTNGGHWDGPARQEAAGRRGAAFWSACFPRSGSAAADLELRLEQIVRMSSQVVDVVPHMSAHCDGMADAPAFEVAHPGSAPDDPKVTMWTTAS